VFRSRKNWLLLLTTAIAIIALVSSLLLGYKLRQLTILIGALNQLPRSRAQRIIPKYLIFQHSTPSHIDLLELNQTVHETYFEIDLYRHFPTVDIACGLLLLFLCVAYFIFRLKHKRQDKLILLISNAENQIEIILMTLKMNTKQCIFRCSEKFISSLAVSGRFYKPILKLGFSNLRMRDLILEKDIEIQNQLRINPMKAWRIRQILNGSCRISLLIKRDSKLNPVPLVNGNNDKIESFYQIEVAQVTAEPTAPEFCERQTRCLVNTLNTEHCMYPLTELKTMAQDNVTFVKDE
jgi:hypothetical protein